MSANRPRRAYTRASPDATRASKAGTAAARWNASSAPRKSPPSTSTSPSVACIAAAETGDDARASPARSPDAARGQSPAFASATAYATRALP